MSDDAAAALMAHDWPGNVRELRNSIERVKLLAREKIITAADLNLPHPGVGDTAQVRAAEPEGRARRGHGRPRLAHVERLGGR